MSHIDWITPKLTQITEQQVLLLREVEKLQSNVSRLSASEGASQRRHTTAEVMTAEGYRRSLQGRAASMPMAPGHVDPTNELGLLKQYVANLHQKHHQGMVALQEIVDGTQQSVHELYLKQAELEDAVETCRLQRQKTPLPSSAPSEEGSAGVTPAQLERRLREVILDIKWGLLDAVKEVSPREATEDDEEEGDYYANKSHVRERQFLATPPSALATDFSQKFQLLALSTTPLQQTTQKAISTNSEAVDEIIANVDEAIKNILSRIEVLEVYSPHQQSVAARPPLLGLELEDLRDTDGVRTYGKLVFGKGFSRDPGGG
ncbi:hypothetical protein AGDE_13979 [Angomonas deanei]|nr:hypothetical protein AGDE_13979 [Angomonas deanei]|eukprot:EPY21582.1 hypothetical protein AGDE_13979 [Angomonas deanei]